MFSTVRPYRRFPCAMLAPVKRLVLATLLIFSSEPVYAEWVAVAITPPLFEAFWIIFEVRNRVADKFPPTPGVAGVGVPWRFRF